jgi:ribonuclease HI
MAKNELPYVVVYTDGACSGNPGPGGWGTVIVMPDLEVIELGGREIPTTNNRMEISAALRGLQALSQIDYPVHLYTDSTYLIRGITQWVWGWRKNGWKTAEGKEVQNRALWEELSRVIAARKPDCKVEWKWVRGHTGHAGNERCDQIAVAFSQNRTPNLYRGDLKDYGLPLLDFPDTENGLPEMKPKAEKKAAYSYLSYVDGQAMRHKDWPSCERRTKGRSGAKFKKTSSADDEVTVLKSWGLDSSKLKSE